MTFLHTMKKFRWQLIIIFLTGLVVGILLISEQPGGGSSILSPEPAKGGNYTEAVVGSLQRLNPLLDFYNPTDRDIDRLIFSRLLRFDEHGNPQPELAAQWGISEDGTVYNVALQENAVWHDGEKVRAQDVVFTVEMLRSQNNVVPADLQEFWNEIEVVALSDTQLQFRLPEAYAPFLDYLSFGVLPEHLLGDLTFDQMIEAGFNLQPVGSGPYSFGGLIVEEGQLVGVELNAFADYFGQKPYIEQMIMRFYPDGPSALKAYQEGIVQGINPVGEDILQQVLAEPNISVYSGRRPELSMVLFNLKDPSAIFLQDVNVRRALYKAINRQYIVDRMMQGQAILADGPIFPGTWAYYAETEAVTFNAEEAAALLENNGYKVTEESGDIRSKDGATMQFTMLVPDTEDHKAIAESIQRDWEKIGVQVDLETVAYNDLIENRLGGRNYQAALVDLNLSRSPDPDPYPFWDQVQATGGQNFTQWDNRVASEYLEQARTTLNQGERARMYKNFQVLFARELPALPLFYPVYTYAVDQSVGGVSMGPLFDTSDRFATVLNWYLVSTNVETAENVTTTTP